MTAIPEPTRDLLAALLEALDIPLPATMGDDAAYQRLLADRAGQVAVSLRGLLKDDQAGDADPAWEAVYLRKNIAKLPITYRAWDETKTEAGR